MDQPGYGANTIEANGISMLLTVAGGDAVHLTRLADPGVLGRAAIDDRYLDDSQLSQVPTRANYDRDALLAPRWSDKTICGRDWAMMIGGEGGTLGQWDDVTAFAPTCRKCLASLDKLFPAPTDNERLPLIAQVVADLIVEHGFAEIHDVPGDQLAALRKQIRAKVRAATGHPIETHHINDVLYLSCDPIYRTHAVEYQREAVQAVQDLLSGDGTLTPMDPKSTASWTTWASEG